MEHHFVIETEDSPTILSRIIQTIKRRRISINALTAFSLENESHHGIVNLIVDGSEEQVKLLKAQLGKLIDVIKIY